jgi:hypothetical protein
VHAPLLTRTPQSIAGLHARHIATPPVHDLAIACRLTSKKYKGIFEMATNIFQKDGTARVFVLRAQV